MSFLKKYWYLVLVTIITAGIGIAAYITSVKLEQKSPIAPSVPQVTPQAVAPACKLVFSIRIPSPTITPTPPLQCNSVCTATADCPTSMICNGGFCRNPSCVDAANCTCTPSPTPTRTPTPTTPPQCNGACATDANCPSTMICYTGLCRNPSCVEETDCTCAVPTPTPTPTTTSVTQPTPTTAIPTVPVSGIGPTYIGMLALAGGFLFILLGLAF